MFEFQVYVRDVERTIAPLLYNDEWLKKKVNTHDFFHILVHLGYLLLLGEEHLEPSIMDEIWKSLPPEDRLFLKTCMIDACRYIRSQDMLGTFLLPMLADVLGRLDKKPYQEID